LIKEINDSKSQTLELMNKNNELTSNKESKLTELNKKYTISVAKLESSRSINDQLQILLTESENA